MNTDRVLDFFLAARALPLRDSITRGALLIALHESGIVKKQNGASVLWLADKIDSGSEVVRHHLRVLRAEGAVAIADRLGRTEFFALTPETGEKLERWLGGYR